MFIFGCNKTPNAPDSMRVNNPNTPSTGPGTSVTDIATPTLSGPSTATSSDAINLSWTNGGTPNDCSSASEYWGSTQLSMWTNPGGVCSGHTEIYQDGIKIAESQTGTYSVGPLADGTYHFTVKEKSLEKFTEPSNAADATHHSGESNEITVVVQSCTEVAIADSYSITCATGGPGTWNCGTATYTMNNHNSNVNMFWNVQRYTRTQNSCTNVITSTPATWNNSTSLYLSVNGGTSWTAAQVYDNTALAYHVNGVFNAGLGKPGTGPLPSGAGTYTVIYSTTPSLAGQIATSTLVEP